MERAMPTKGINDTKKKRTRSGYESAKTHEGHEGHEADEADEANGANEGNGANEANEGEIDEHDHDKTSFKDIGVQVPIKVYLYALCAALNSVNLGYDIGVSTNVGPLLQDSFSLTDAQLELFLGSLNFWSIGGALLSPCLCDAWGRRATFAMAATGFLAGIAVMSLSPTTSFATLMMARAVVGLGVGIGEAIDPMYIAEIAPPSLRGELVSWAEAGVAVGVVAGFSSSLLFWNCCHDSDQKWRYMLALGMIMPVIMLILVSFVMPESPRWLITKNRVDEARVVLAETYPENANVDQVISDIRESLLLEQAAAANKQTGGWTALLCRPGPAVRRMLLVGVGIAIIQQAVGIDAVMFYLIFVIRQSGIASDLGQIIALCILGTVKLGFVFVGAKLFDKVGRRIMLFISLLGMAASLVTVSITFTSPNGADNNDDDDNIHDPTWKKVVCVGALASYLAFFSTGLGPGNWVVVSEVFATSIRAKAMSLAVLPNRITATLMASSFLTVARVLTWPGFFLLLAAICLASCLFLYIYLPETKGRSLEEMSLYFAQVTGDESILRVEAQLVQERAMQRQEEQQQKVSGTIMTTTTLTIIKEMRNNDETTSTGIMA